MSIYEHDYRRQVCPFCKSARLTPVRVIRPNEMYALNNYYEKRYAQSRMIRSGFLCKNCQRYHPNRRVKFITDRSQMQRDFVKLQKLLAKGTKNAHTD